MARMLAKMLKGAPHAQPENNAVVGAHAERVSTHFMDLKSCRDAANMLNSPSTALNERIAQHSKRIEAFRHVVRTGGYTYRLRARSIRLTQSYALVKPDSLVQIDAGSFREIKRETRKIRAAVAREYARQKHRRHGLLGWVTETPTRAALAVLCASAYSAGSWLYAVWDLNALKTTFVVSSMLAIGGGLVALDKKMKNAGYVVLGGLAGAALSFAKMMSSSEVAVLLSGIPVGILGSIIAMRRILEYTDARAKKKTIKQGNPFTLGKK